MRLMPGPARAGGRGAYANQGLPIEPEETAMRRTNHALLDGTIGAAGALAILAMPFLVAFCLSASGPSAWSQTPRSIKMVVPIGAGSGLDIMARLLAEHVSRTQGVTIVVENRPGAVQVVATEAVAHAVPDGNTVLLMANPFVINPHLRRVCYD